MAPIIPSNDNNNIPPSNNKIEASCGPAGGGRSAHVVTGNDPAKDKQFLIDFKKRDTTPDMNLTFDEFFKPIMDDLRKANVDYKKMAEIINNQQTWFNSYDDNGNGRLNIDEYTHLMQDYTGFMAGIDHKKTETYAEKVEREYNTPMSKDVDGPPQGPEVHTDPVAEKRNTLRFWMTEHGKSGNKMTLSEFQEYKGLAGLTITTEEELEAVISCAIEFKELSGGKDYIEL